ncbi:MAG: tripartite tricarboxylate transporter substrate binding protein [Alphaproteobacteria bacterium]|nr:tripartite tricarboxylate transporter substrate binding protein [Alphaproteobacteria bacterium]
MPLLPRRAASALGLSAIGVAAIGNDARLPSAAAQGAHPAWPSRPLRLVVPFASGAGVLDIMARLVGSRLGEALGQPVVIDNRPGAGGIVGAEVVAKAEADGSTLLMGNIALVVSPYLYARLPFDPLADFVPVTRVNSSPLLLVVHPAVPAQSVTELIAYAKARPGQLNYGSGGIGTTPWLATELLKSITGIDVVHVPYKGGAPALADLVAGQLAFMIENVPGTLPMVQSGKLRALAISSAERLALVRELPTISESGVPGYEMVGWNGVFASKVTPLDIVSRLNAAFAGVLHSAEVKEQMATLGAESVGDSTEAFAAFVKSEASRWGQIIRERGIKPE